MANTQFYPLSIKNIKRETTDTVSISFAIPEELKSEFSFIAGQYLTVKAVVDGAEVRRAYSICSATDESDLRVAVKKVEGGQFSIFANDVLKTGDTLDVMPPMGNFKLEPRATESYLGIAAGSGITPVMSMIKTALKVGSSFTLYYGSKKEDEIIFKSELDELLTQFPKNFKVNHVLSREEIDGFDHGRIDGNYIDNQSFHPAAYSGVYLCGPEEMIHTSSDMLISLGFDKGNILFELFSTPVEELNGELAELEENFIAEVKVILDDEETVLQVPTDGDSILELGLAADLDLPFACKGGVCCTCKAQVIEGKVEMKMNYALDDSEVEEGYVLTCQSHPRSKKIVLDYDV